MVGSVQNTDGAGRERISSAEVTALFNQFRPALLRFFERRSFSPPDAEDMTQEVFLRITRLGGAREIWQPAGFLFQTAANVMRDRLRRDAVRHRNEHVCYDDVDAGDEAPSEEAVYEEREALSRFIAALEELTPKCRMVFLLHKYEDLSYSDIARRLEVSVSAIEKHMMNAIRHIKRRRSADE
jgi:RNA polymerase sigma-70 factor (ECF subfamily)